MRSFRLALLALPLAGGLAAQSRDRGTERLHAPVLQTATFDVAAAFQQHYRAMIEPLVFGRFAIGISGEYTTEQDDQTQYPVAYGACPINRLCAIGSSNNENDYRAWNFNLHARWYPAALSLGGRRQSASVYLGEFIGYHERRTSQPVYYGCPNCYYPPPMDTTQIPPNPYPYPGPSGFVQTLHGWEPGVEFGVRLLPMRHVVMDIGGRFRLATIQDFQSPTRPGGVDSRLVVALGIGW